MQSIYQRYKYAMSTIWTKYLALTDGPWRIQDPNRGIIYDLQDRRIATVPKSGEIPYKERQANLAAIAAVPELIAALRQAAYALDQMGVPLRPEFYDLINRATPDAAELVPRSVREAGVDQIVVRSSTSECVQPTEAQHQCPKNSPQATPQDPTEETAERPTDPPNLCS